MLIPYSRISLTIKKNAIPTRKENKSTVQRTPVCINPNNNNVLNFFDSYQVANCFNANMLVMMPANFGIQIILYIYIVHGSGLIGYLQSDVTFSD